MNCCKDDEVCKKVSMAGPFVSSTCVKEESNSSTTTEEHWPIGMSCNDQSGCGRYCHCYCHPGKGCQIAWEK